MRNLSNVSYCGCYCKNCGEKLRFRSFWVYFDEIISGCRDNNCGAPLCEIRQCAIQRKIELCAECTDYPCPKVATVAKTYPMILANGARIREIGLESWIREQEIRPAGAACLGARPEAGIPS
jgi:hypothetical protein